ncbi:MAG: hypothetical protein FWG51_06055 [Firmicutes bacterium]|nr:hypothetical protein [Bacillota bacterium]
MQNKYISQKEKRPLNKFQEAGYKQPKYIDGKQPAVDYKDIEDLARHYSKHEAECEVCDYIEKFSNLDKEKFKEMFIFSELISKPVSMRKKK